MRRKSVFGAAHCSFAVFFRHQIHLVLWIFKHINVTSHTALWTDTYIYIMQLYSHSYLPYSFAVGCDAGWHDLVDASEEQQHWYNQPMTRHRSSFCNIPVYTRYTAQKPRKTNTHSDDKTCRYKTDAHIFIVWLCVSDCVCLCVSMCVVFSFIQYINISTSVAAQ